MGLGGPGFFVLAALAVRPMSGYELMVVVRELSEGRVRLTTSTLFILLDRLAETGLLTVERAERAGPDLTRYYRLTDHGDRALAAAAARAAGRHIRRRAAADPACVPPAESPGGLPGRAPVERTAGLRPVNGWRRARHRPAAAGTGGNLGRRYRRWLWAYPGWYRRERGAELLAVLLDAAPPGRLRPRWADALDLLWSGLRCRLRLPRGAAFRLAAIATTVPAMLVGASLVALMAHFPDPLDAESTGPPDNLLPAAAAELVAGVATGLVGWLSVAWVLQRQRRHRPWIRSALAGVGIPTLMVVAVFDLQMPLTLALFSGGLSSGVMLPTILLSGGVLFSADFYAVLGALVTLLLAALPLPRQPGKPAPPRYPPADRGPTATPA